MRKSALGQPVGLLYLPGEEINFPSDKEVHLNLSQQSQGIRRAASQGVRQRQRANRGAIKVPHISLLTQGYASFEQRDGLVQGALPHM
jgi:hypothetical protein